MSNLTTVVDITPERKRLLNCLENSEYGSVAELCRDAKVARDVYYDAVKSEEFVKILFDNSSAGIYTAIPQIITKIIKQAKAGSFVHQKMLLEMMKIYQGTPAVAIDARTQIIINPEQEKQIQEEYSQLMELKEIMVKRYGSLEEGIKENK